MRIGDLYTRLITENIECHPIKITEEIANEVNQYKSDEDLLRAGGLSIEALDRAAFGFTSEDIKTLMPNQLHIKWKGDWTNVKFEQEEYARRGLSKIAWAKKK